MPLLSTLGEPIYEPFLPKKDVSEVCRPSNIDEARVFWKEQQASGNVDEIFKQMQNQLQVLWQNIKDGSATNQEYVRAMCLVNEAGLSNIEATSNEYANIFIQIRIFKRNCKKIIYSEHTRMDQCLDIIRSECEKEASSPQPECGSLSLLSTGSPVAFHKHTCNESCLSEVKPFIFNKNPMKFPILCQFQRRHGKTNCLSRELDVIYKAPCGRSLRNFEEVRSYLFETKCNFLSVDNFSFSTFLQLDRNTPQGQVFAQDCDISKDAETVPVSFCNEIDNTKLSSFKYRKSPWPSGYSINNYNDIFVDSCSCTDGCLDVSTCACLQLTVRGYKESLHSTDTFLSGYKYKRLSMPILSGLYECNLSCKCDRKMCQNRVVQHGLQVRLQVFKTRKQGWGVRCLDDIDQGTFVCIYSGRILIRTRDANQSNLLEHSNESDNEDEEKRSSIISSVIVHKRKRRISHSDSEITVLSSDAQKGIEFTHSQSPSDELDRMKNTSSGKSVELSSVKRPKTKTAILQKRRKQLMEEGTCTLQHSSEDECSYPPSSVKAMPSKQEGDVHEPYIANIAVSPGESELLKAKLADEAILGYVSEESNSSILSGTQSLSESKCKDNDVSLETCVNETASRLSLLEIPEENVCCLDATKEGNVGRFLNHSCNPNLFVQTVFVETHNKRFPWVAFFTKRLVKAGTELTWDYNYDNEWRFF
ncbi:histone-lysine N-methyltransferase SETDB2 [Bombina bombina]|uniref:histone-lysine N-methyltransferase SETDB2 n=1 Tax=Bombina bombina TaxID=8345 RepID=UPI00235B1EE1|nr:histone-lysine N-methyltransferase SETDB2 [Bombina bombina]